MSHQANRRSSSTLRSQPEIWFQLGTARLAYAISEFRRIVPLWTAGTLQAGIVEFGPESRPLTKGWINLEFGRSGNWSRVGEDPGQMQIGSEGTCQSVAFVHAFGHALGYWHTRVRPSIMGGGTYGTCALFELPPNEVAIARAMYARAPGNLEDDKDGPPPPPVIYTRLAVRDPVILRCDDFIR